MQPDPLSTQEGTQPEPNSVQEVAKPAPTPIVQRKKSSNWGITAIVLGIFVFVLLVAVAGLGFWAYTLTTKLTATQQQLTALQGEHNKLQTDYATLTSDNEKLNTDLTQTKTDLEKANADLATAQADLKKSQDQNKSLNAKIDLARRKAEILYAVSTVKSATDFLQVDTLIKATNDIQLLTQWNKFASSPTTESSVNFILYLISSIVNDLK
jgi:uncharacterized protein (DUF3084 family)